MRKKSWVLLCNLFLLCFCLACHHPNESSTNIRISETKNNYTMEANFNSEKTRTIDNYMNKKIGNASDVNFQNSVIDAQLTFDDHLSFYIKKHPGFIKIVFDKNASTPEALAKMQSLYNGIKEILAK